MGKFKKKITNNKSAALSKHKVFLWTSLAVAALLSSLIMGTIFAFCIQGPDKSKMVKPINGAVIIPMEKVSDGTVHFYRFNDGKREIVFFVVRGSDGVFHTAFDACEVCYREQKGYAQKGDYLLCKACDAKYAINMIGQENGFGCKPIKLRHFEEAKNIIIKEADIRSGARLF
jgi:uncharacterized membrane protein